MIAAVSPATLRKGQRRAHLLGAAVLLAYVYAPLETELPRIRRTSRRFRRSPDGALDRTRKRQQGIDRCNSASSMST